MNSQKQKYIYISITLLLWSSAFVGIRYAITEYSAFHLALLRYFVASLVFIVIAFFVKFKTPEKRDLLMIGYLGLSGFVLYNIFLNLGQRYVTASSASFIVNTMPIFTTLISIVVFKEKTNWLQWLGIFIAFTGVGLVLFGETMSITLDINMLFLVAAALIQSSYFISQKYLLSRYKPLELTAYSIWTGTIILMIFSGGIIDQIATAPLSYTLTIIYMGIFPGAIGFLTFSLALQGDKASNVTSFIFLVPFLVVIESWLILNETLSLISFVGGILIISGIIIKNKN